MTRISNWLMQILTGLLEPAERDAVRGDLAESGVTGTRALGDVLGLVVRRQAALWCDWRPWLALIGIVVLVGMVLIRDSHRLFSVGAVYLWMYWDNGRMADLENAGVRHMLAGDIASFAIGGLALLFWSWTAGFVLGSLSRRTLWITGSLFALVLLAPPIYAPRLSANTPVYAQTFYRTVLPWAVQLGLVVLPVARGAWRGRKGVLRPIPAVILAAALAAVTAADQRIWSGARVQLPQLLFLTVTIWPAVYVIATARSNRRGQAA